jgi:Icc-related predicted phosphoesterase
LPPCFFVTDLHGRRGRYETLLDRIERERPAAVFLGGDLLPPPFLVEGDLDLVAFLAARFIRIRARLGAETPEVFLILGNDDGRLEEDAVLDAAASGAWRYVHGRRVEWAGLDVYGYSYCPPTPFRLKDWERYDVSRYVDPGCVSPEEGLRTVPLPENVLRYSTIEADLEELVGERHLERTVVLFHAPPYRTTLDRAALDGKTVEHVPLDPNVGSIAIRRFIETRQPLLTLHGHVHESARLTGAWRDRIGRTHCLGAAHDGPELALVRFDPEDLAAASRELL